MSFRYAAHVRGHSLLYNIQKGSWHHPASWQLGRRPRRTRLTHLYLWGMASSGMLLRVVPDVLDELSAYIIRVTRISEPGTLAVTSNRRTLRRNNSYSPGIAPYDFSVSPIVDSAISTQRKWSRQHRSRCWTLSQITANMTHARKWTISKVVVTNTFQVSISTECCTNHRNYR
jgi:hypothetical protein